MGIKELLYIVGNIMLVAGASAIIVSVLALLLALPAADPLATLAVILVLIGAPLVMIIDWLRMRQDPKMEQTRKLQSEGQ